MQKLARKLTLDLHVNLCENVRKLRKAPKNFANLAKNFATNIIFGANYPKNLHLGFLAFFWPPRVAGGWKLDGREISTSRKNFKTACRGPARRKILKKLLRRLDRGVGGMRGAPKIRRTAVGAQAC